MHPESLEDNAANCLLFALHASSLTLGFAACSGRISGLRSGSQTFTVPSSPAEARCIPIGLHATERTELACPLKVRTSFPVSGSVILTSPPEVPMTRSLPSGLHDTEVGTEGAGDITFRRSAINVSQISSSGFGPEAVSTASQMPSGLHESRGKIGRLFFVRMSSNSSPETPSQILIIPASSPVAKRLRSRLQARAPTASLWPLSTRFACPVFASETLTVPSPLAKARRAPSGAQAMATIPVVVLPSKVRHGALVDASQITTSAVPFSTATSLPSGLHDPR